MTSIVIFNSAVNWEEKIHSVLMHLLSTQGAKDEILSPSSQWQRMSLVSMLVLPGD